MIRATCRTDDFRHDVTFDATPWFRQATDEYILALAAAGWGGGEAADEVAYHCRLRVRGLAELFDHLDRQPDPLGPDPVGFECHVDGGAAAAWLRTHRPGVYARLGPPNRASEPPGRE